MRPKVIEVNDLKTRFYTQEGTVHAVNGISYHVDEGETLGIVGESGCGKSVSVLSVLKLLPQPPAHIESKEVLFNGKDISTIPNDEMREIRGSQIATSEDRTHRSVSDLGSVPQQTETP